MSYRASFALLLLLDTLFLLLEIPHLAISGHEAQLLYGAPSVVQMFSDFFITLFGNNIYALRLPFLLLHVSSVVLLYNIAEPYAKYERDRLWLVVIYMLLPGSNSAALLVDSAGLVIFCVMLYLYLYQNFGKRAYLLLPLLLFIDESFMFLFLALTLYAYERHKRDLFLLGGALFIASLLLYGFDVGGVPRGRFLDTLGLYGAIFSPILFIYLFYVLYRTALFGKKDQIFYIAATAFLLSILLSFRQRVDVTAFAPFMMPALILAMKHFFHAYRVRLKRFRNGYRLLFALIFITLIANALLTFFNKELYGIIDDPKRHFAYDYHISEALARALRMQAITCIETDDTELRLQLRFYGISACDIYKLEELPLQSATSDVTIFHDTIPIYRANVTKIHNN